MFFDYFLVFSTTKLTTTDTNKNLSDTDENYLNAIRNEG